jgi:hypothetical protein
MPGAGLKAAVGFTLVLMHAGLVSAGSYEEGSTASRALHTELATVANAVPVASAFYAPKCLPGYFLCKLSFAAVSVVAAADQLIFSGGGDLAQTRAILYRGFAGDWLLDGRHTAGDLEAHPLPDPPAPVGEGEGTWQPPPL